MQWFLYSLCVALSPCLSRFIVRSVLVVPIVFVRSGITFFWIFIFFCLYFVLLVCFVAFSFVSFVSFVSMIAIDFSFRFVFIFILLCSPRNISIFDVNANNEQRARSICFFRFAFHIRICFDRPNRLVLIWEQQEVFHRGIEPKCRMEGFIWKKRKRSNADWHRVVWTAAALTDLHDVWQCFQQIIPWTNLSFDELRLRFCGAERTHREM